MIAVFFLAACQSETRLCADGIPVAAPEIEAEAKVPFVLKAAGGRFRRYRVLVPEGAVSVTARLVVEEVFFDERWGSSTSLGLGPKDAEKPNRTDVFARLSLWHDGSGCYVRLRSAKGEREVPVSGELAAGTAWTWEAKWPANELSIRLNDRDLTGEPRTWRPEVLHLSVSGMRVRVESVDFQIPTPAGERAAGG